MAIDDLIREDILKVAAEQQVLSKKYESVTDHLGHMMHLQTNYTLRVLKDSFDITDNDISNYTRAQNEPKFYQGELELKYNKPQLELELDKEYDKHMDDTWN